MTIDPQKICILYHCHPINAGISHLKYFLANAHVEDIDTFVSCVDFDAPANYQSVKFFQCENDSHDFGGFSRLLLDHINIDHYEFFIFINSSCLGPFIESDQKYSWILKFLEKMRPGVEAVGSTINCLNPLDPYYQLMIKSGSKPPFYHIQTYAYLLTKRAINLLIQSDFYQYPTDWTKIETIIKYEIGLSKLLQKNGHNIAALTRYSDNIDFRERSEATKTLEKIGDPCFPNALSGENLSKHEVLFVKPSRCYADISDVNLATYTKI